MQPEETLTGGKKKKAMCEDQEKNSIALLSKLIYEHYLQCLM